MQRQGINANIMSLGGIAIGAMVDAAVVMIENAHKKIEAWREAHPGEELRGEHHWQVITAAAVEVGPALFFCLLIITLSFIPVFTLEAQEGRLFGPLPGLSAQKAAQLLQQTDRLIKTVPEVAHVFGKAGRAETATDPAPLEMFETTIQFKPRDQWRQGMTQEKLVEELDRAVQVPGLANLWIPPIRNCIL